jgi:integrase
VVPIGAPLAEVLTQAMRGKLPAARVVLNSNGGTPSRQAVLSALKELQKRHSLPLWSFHSLRHYFLSALVRHYFLSALVRGGANLEAVRELAGHSKLLTTQRRGIRVRPWLVIAARDLRASQLPRSPRRVRDDGERAGSVKRTSGSSPGWARAVTLLGVSRSKAGEAPRITR